MVTIRREVPVEQVNSTQPGSSNSMSGAPMREDYYMQPHLLELQNRKTLMMAREEQKAPPAASAAIPRQAPRAPLIVPQQNIDRQATQMDVILLGQQNRKRLMMARLEEEYKAKQHQHQQILEQQKKFKHMFEMREQNRMSTQSLVTLPTQDTPQIASTEDQYPPIPAGTFRKHSLQDYQVQLMLLEQQNKKRLMMQNQEREKRALNAYQTVPSSQSIQQDAFNFNTTTAPHTTSTNEIQAPTQGSGANHALQDYQTRLHLLEQRNKEQKEERKRQCEELLATTILQVKDCQEQIKRLTQEQEDRFTQGLGPCPEKNRSIAIFQKRLKRATQERGIIQDHGEIEPLRHGHIAPVECCGRKMAALEKEDREGLEVRGFGQMREQTEESRRTLDD